MSKSMPRRQEGVARDTSRTVRSASEQAYQSFIIGYDDEGYTHHYYAAADTVVVYANRELDDRVHLDGATVRSYVEFVTQFRSWRRMGQFYGLAMHYERAQAGDA
jgi:hypothetical protein